MKRAGAARNKTKRPGDWKEVGRASTGLIQLGAGGSIYLVDRVERTRRWPDGTIECSTIMDPIPVNVGHLEWFAGGRFRHLAAWVKSKAPDASSLELELRKALEVIEATTQKKTGRAKRRTT